MVIITYVLVIYCNVSVICCALVSIISLDNYYEVAFSLLGFDKLYKFHTFSLSITKQTAYAIKIREKESGSNHIHVYHDFLLWNTY